MFLSILKHPFDKQMCPKLCIFVTFVYFDLLGLMIVLYHSKHPFSGFLKYFKVFRFNPTAPLIFEVLISVKIRIKLDRFCFIYFFIKTQLNVLTKLYLFLINSLFFFCYFNFSKINMLKNIRKNKEIQKKFNKRNENYRIILYVYFIRKKYVQLNFLIQFYFQEIR